MRSRLPKGIRFLMLVIFCLNLSICKVNSALRCEHCTNSEVEFLSNDKMLYHCIGDALFLTETARISCDSAVWLNGIYVRLNGNVRIDDEEYYLAADSTYFDIERNVMIARGEVVELWSYQDSIYTVGNHVIFDRANQYLFMDDRPLLYLKYPDTANMIEVLADTIEYTSDSVLNVANAFGNVVISSKEFSSASGNAIMDVTAGQLELIDNPSAQRGNSDISGDSIRVSYEDDLIRSIVVIDSARGNFQEPVDSLETEFDESILAGQRINMLFENGLMTEIICTGQAYSWYYPSPRGGSELHENSVSGDSIRFQIDNKKLESIDVTGGAIGTYVSGRVPTRDTLVVSKSDSVNYEAKYIHYRMQDSLIVLKEAAGVTSGDVS
ncbi:MAG: hypothetical protein U9R56_06035, partial [candidate division Zixibacteria bacterium]|nr:hypothetical protein [candidate division Zixibacteria bacterium]